MRKLLSLILLVAIGLLVVGNLFDGDLNLKSMSIEDRDSAAYVSKSVNGSTKDVIYGASNNLEDGSANIVSSIVVNYRSFHGGRLRKSTTCCNHSKNYKE